MLEMFDRGDSFVRGRILAVAPNPPPGTKQRILFCRLKKEATQSNSYVVGDFG